MPPLRRIAQSKAPADSFYNARSVVSGPLVTFSQDYKFEEGTANTPSSSMSNQHSENNEKFSEHYRQGSREGLLSYRMEAESFGESLPGGAFLSDEEFLSRESFLSKDFPMSLGFSVSNQVDEPCEVASPCGTSPPDGVYTPGELSPPDGVFAPGELSSPDETFAPASRLLPSDRVSLPDHGNQLPKENSYFAEARQSKDAAVQHKPAAEVKAFFDLKTFVSKQRPRLKCAVCGRHNPSLVFANGTDQFNVPPIMICSMCNGNGGAIQLKTETEPQNAPEPAKKQLVYPTAKSNAPKNKKIASAPPAPRAPTASASTEGSKAKKVGKPRGVSMKSHTAGLAISRCPNCGNSSSVGEDWWYFKLSQRHNMCRACNKRIQVSEAADKLKDIIQAGGFGLLKIVGSEETLKLIQQAFDKWSNTSSKTAPNAKLKTATQVATSPYASQFTGPPSQSNAFSGGSTEVSMQHHQSTMTMSTMAMGPPNGPGAMSYHSAMASSNHGSYNQNGSAGSFSTFQSSHQNSTVTSGASQWGYNGVQTPAPRPAFSTFASGNSQQAVFSYRPNPIPYDEMEDAELDATMPDVPLGTDDPEYREHGASLPGAPYNDEDDDIYDA